MGIRLKPWSAPARRANLSGAPYMVAGTMAAAGLDVVAKTLTDAYPVIQLMWFRYTIHLLVVVVVYAPRLKWKLLDTHSLSLQLFRSLMLVATTAFFFLALHFLPVAETTAILYAAPVITVLLARPVLSERVGPRTAVAAAIGFVGVVAVIQPFSGLFGLAALLPLGAAFASSIYMMMTRLIGQRDPAPTTWFYTGCVGVVVATVITPFFWIRPQRLTDLILLVLLGVLGAGGHFMFIKAHQRAPASSLAPLGYMELGFVTLMGLAFFNDFPNALAVIGIGLIVAGGIAVAGRHQTTETGLI